MAVQGSKEYTPAFKREAVALVIAEGYTLIGDSRNFGINRDMLRRWKRELAQEGGVAFPGKGKRWTKLKCIASRRRIVGFGWSGTFQKKPRPS
jgi:transposase-like protein